MKLKSILGLILIVFTFNSNCNNDNDEPNVATAPTDDSPTLTTTAPADSSPTTLPPKKSFGFKFIKFGKNNDKSKSKTDSNEESNDVNLQQFSATEGEILVSEKSEKSELAEISGNILGQMKNKVGKMTGMATADSGGDTKDKDSGDSVTTEESGDAGDGLSLKAFKYNKRKDKSKVNTELPMTTIHQEPINESPKDPATSDDTGVADGNIKSAKTKLLGKFKKIPLPIKLKSKDVTLKTFSDVESEPSEKSGFFNQFKKYQDKWHKNCWRDIGCFYATEFNESARTIPLLPQSPDFINPVFHMYTQEHRTIPRNFSYNATAAQFRYSTFNASLRTAFIVHGFQSGYALWLENMKDLIFYKSKDQFNVVVVIWEKGAKTPIYNIAASNTRVVGALIGFFINRLCNTFNITNDRFWLIGHSLGAHTMGLAGKRLKNPSVGRITGLDPAGVGFHFKGSALRLDHSDANIVDVIHSDAALSYTEGFGTADTLGHFDFYPNGGSWQPACPKSGSVTEKFSSTLGGKDITCSHSRACYLANNLGKPEDDCEAIAYQCDNYEMFLEGRCASCEDLKCQPMGLNPNYWIDQTIDEKTVDTRYYINTADKEEYCLYHYQFGLHISNNSDSTTGILNITLNATVGEETRELIFSRNMTKTIQRKVHTFLLTFDFKVNQIHSMSIEWRRYNISEQNRYNRGYKLEIPIVEVYYMSHMDQKIRDQHSNVFCPADGPLTRIIANRQKVFYKPCTPKLKVKARDLPPSELKPLTFKDDIWAVDYMKEYAVWHKISTSIYNIK